MSESTAGPRIPQKLARVAGELTFTGKFGLSVVIICFAAATFGPVFAPYEVGALVAPDVFESFSAAHPLGSDYLGRDVLSRLLSATRYTVFLALFATVLASSLGTSLALFAAVSPRWIDESLSRFMDTLISIPSKIFALVMIAAFNSSLPLLLIVAAIAYMPGAYRIARSLAVNLNQMDYVEVAYARGEQPVYIAMHEILPNMIHSVLADFGLRFVYIVLLLSGMSFLGLGVQPPDSDLGSLVRENISGLPEAAPAIVVPALAIAGLTIGVNLLIDSLSGQRKASRVKTS